MKKTLLIMVMALAVLLTQCRKPEVKFPSPVAPEGTTVSMTVTAGPGSKTDITDEGAITWSEGDKLYVGYNGEYVGYLTLTNGQNTPTGTFNGDVTLPEGTTGEKTFHFFYLGSTERTLAVGAKTAYVSFATQEIYAEGGKLKNASKRHVGYGSAKGTVAGSEVTGINVTLVSKVALARFSFKKGGADYIGTLTLRGDQIYSGMTVGFGGTFSPGTKGDISIAGGHAERYVMLVPTGATETQTLTFTGSVEERGTGAVSGLESNKFYGKTDAIAVTLTAPAPTPPETVNMGLPSPYDKLEWATCNLGASKPEEYGDYYAWGETAPYYKDGVWCAHPSHNDGIIFDKYNCYGWKNYLDGSHNFWNISYEWTTPPYDATTKILTSNCDAATKNWGSGWRMPTIEEWEALNDYTTKAWTDNYNGTHVAGIVFTSTDGRGASLFCPAAGYWDGIHTDVIGELLLYWSSNLNTDDTSEAWTYFGWDEGGAYGESDVMERNCGQSFRPVRSQR